MVQRRRRIRRPGRRIGHDDLAGKNLDHAALSRQPHGFTIARPGGDQRRTGLDLRHAIRDLDDRLPIHEDWCSGGEAFVGGEPTGTRDGG